MSLIIEGALSSLAFSITNNGTWEIGGSTREASITPIVGTDDPIFIHLSTAQYDWSIFSTTQTETELAVYGTELIDAIRADPLSSHIALRYFSKDNAMSVSIALPDRVLCEVVPLFRDTRLSEARHYVMAIDFHGFYTQPGPAGLPTAAQFRAGRVHLESTISFTNKPKNS